MYFYIFQHPQQRRDFSIAPYYSLTTWYFTLKCSSLKPYIDLILIRVKKPEERCSYAKVYPGCEKVKSTNTNQL